MPKSLLLLEKDTVSNVPYIFARPCLSAVLVIIFIQGNYCSVKWRSQFYVFYLYVSPGLQSSISLSMKRNLFLWTSAAFNKLHELAIFLLTKDAFIYVNGSLILQQLIVFQLQLFIFINATTKVSPYLLLPSTKFAQF